MDSSTKKPFPMELIGDFQVPDSIFKRWYGDSLLYSDENHLYQLRQQGIHLPTYQGEIPVLLAPLYWQVREIEVTKQSPPKVITTDLLVESAKTTHSTGKGVPHHSSGCGSNTSTPKCPDSTLAKKPSGSKEPILNSQKKSPKACSAHKCSHSASSSARSVWHKWQDVCMELPHTRCLHPQVMTSLMTSSCHKMVLHCNNIRFL